MFSIQNVIGSIIEGKPFGLLCGKLSFWLCFSKGKMRHKGSSQSFLVSHYQLPLLFFSHLRIAVVIVTIIKKQNKTVYKISWVQWISVRRSQKWFISFLHSSELLWEFILTHPLDEVFGIPYFFWTVVRFKKSCPT